MTNQKKSKIFFFTGMGIFLAGLTSPLFIEPDNPRIPFTAMLVMMLSMWIALALVLYSIKIQYEKD